LAIFDGYDGRGTEDLYVCFHRWYPAGLRIGAIPHSLCDHVIEIEKIQKRKFIFKPTMKKMGNLKIIYDKE